MGKILRNHLCLCDRRKETCHPDTDDTGWAFRGTACIVVTGLMRNHEMHGFNSRGCSGQEPAAGGQPCKQRSFLAFYTASFKGKKKKVQGFWWLANPDAGRGLLVVKGFLHSPSHLTTKGGGGTCFGHLTPTNTSKSYRGTEHEQGHGAPAPELLFGIAEWISLLQPPVLKPWGILVIPHIKLY